MTGVSLRDSTFEVACGRGGDGGQIALTGYRPSRIFLPTHHRRHDGATPAAE